MSEEAEDIENSKKERVIARSLNSDTKIGFIGNFLFPRMQNECALMYLFEDCWEVILENAELDFILIQPEIVGHFKDWQEFAIADGETNKEFKKLLAKAKKKSIPIVLWHTGDAKELDLYMDFSKSIDLFCAADENLANAKKEYIYLPPAAATSIFNPFMRQELLNRGEIAVSSFLRMHGDQELFPQFCRLGKRTVFYDYNAAVADRIALNIQQFNKNGIFLDCTKLDNKLDLFSSCCGHFDIEASSVSFAWSRVEVAASYVPQANFVKSASGWPCDYKDIDEAMMEAVRNVNDEIYGRRNAHIMWRKALSEHTICDRLDVIKEALKIADKRQPLKISVATPTCRAENIELAIENFERQNYEEKELFLFLHKMTKEVYLETKKKYPWCNVISVPESETVGGMMNMSANMAKGDFIFKMDDDDFYGESYLSDLALYQKITDCDLLGKRASIYNFDSDGEEVYELMRWDSRMTNDSLHHGENWIAGNTISVRRELLLKSPFPMNGYSNNDSIFLMNLDESVRKVVADPFNMVIKRREELTSHTWHASKSQIIGKAGKDQKKFLEDFIV